MPKDYIEERVINLANYIITENGTVRSAAKKYGVSKSTVHKDVATRLKSINMGTYQEVRTILEKNKNERHIRGGIATKLKYENIRKSKKGSF